MCNEKRYVNDDEGKWRNMINRKLDFHLYKSYRNNCDKSGRPLKSRNRSKDYGKKQPIFAELSTYDGFPPPLLLFSRWFSGRSSVRRPMSYGCAEGHTTCFSWRAQHCRPGGTTRRWRAETLASDAHEQRVVDPYYGFCRSLWNGARPTGTGTWTIKI